MGTIPLAENLRVACGDGVVVRIEAVTTTGDLMAGADGTAEIHGDLGGGRTFAFVIALAGFTDPWLNRFCDALASNTVFRDGLGDVIDGDAMTIPAAPARDEGRLAALVRKGKGARFGDFVGLRSGRDACSAMRLPELEAQAGARACAELDGRLTHVAEAYRDTERAKALRWFLRGMPMAMAVRKVDVDREVTSNVVGRRRR